MHSLALHFEPYDAQSELIPDQDFGIAMKYEISGEEKVFLYFSLFQFEIRRSCTLSSTNKLPFEIRPRKKYEFELAALNRETGEQIMFVLTLGPEYCQITRLTNRPIFPGHYMIYEKPVTYFT